MGSYDHVEDLYKFWKHIGLYSVLAKLAGAGANRIMAQVNRTAAQVFVLVRGYKSFLNIFLACHGAYILQRHALVPKSTSHGTF